jgi:iron complex outermembrane receptor protein
MLRRHSNRDRRAALAAVIVFTVITACNRNTLPGWNEGETVDRNQPQDPKAATEEEWAGRTTTHLEELFEGRFPGVQVFRVDDGIQVRIRGTTSILGDNEPLYVVDGMPIEPGPGGALVGINPSDIEKIEVLKDVSATSLYGGRGANGVILIHTHKRK